MSIQSKSPSLTAKNSASKKTTQQHKVSTLKGNPLRNISADEFADLGLGQVVFVRSISARDLKDFIPEAASMPGDVQFQMIVGADGTPVLISDSAYAVKDWFSQNEVQTLVRH